MKTIVVGYDGSEPADRALGQATELIDDGGTVVLVGAIHMLAGKGGMGHDPIEREDLDQKLHEAKARLAGAGISARTVEGTGEAARVITTEAEDVDADLIIVGNGHKNLLERLLLGSVSDGVSHHTDRNVLVVS